MMGMERDFGTRRALWVGAFIFHGKCIHFAAKSPHARSAWVPGVLQFLIEYDNNPVSGFANVEVQPNLATERVRMILQTNGGQAECFPSAVFAHGTFIRVRPAVRAVVRSLLWVYNVVELAPRPRYVAVRPAEPTPRSSGAGDNRAVIHAWAGVSSEGDGCSVSPTSSSPS